MMAATMPSIGLYKPKVILTKSSPFMLKRKNHSWRPERKKGPLEQFGYVLYQTIGEGPHSKIKLAYHPKEEEYVAIKILQKNKIPKEIYEKFIKREIYIMQQFQHPHIVSNC
jgi:serine/threonine protein kinase